MQLIEDVTSIMMPHIDVIHYGILNIAEGWYLKPEAYYLHRNILELTAALFGSSLPNVINYNTTF